MVGRGAIAIDHLRGGDGVVADDDLAFDIDEAGAGEGAVGTHGELDGAGLVLEDDFEGGGDLWMVYAWPSATSLPQS